MQHISIAFIDVNFIKIVYNMGIKERTYIHFARTHLCGQV